HLLTLCNKKSFLISREAFLNIYMNYIYSIPSAEVIITIAIIIEGIIIFTLFMCSKFNDKPKTKVCSCKRLCVIFFYSSFLLGVRGLYNADINQLLFYFIHSLKIF